MSKRNKRAKQPKVAFIPPGTKEPRGGSFAPNVPTMKFKWRAHALDWDGEWSWGKIDLRIAFGEIVPKLHQFEEMTWAEIEGRTGSHFIDCSDLCKEAQGRLEQIQEGADQLFSLRIDGKHRVWGVREIAMLRLLWWDPEHSVCPSEKKHT